ncbi:MAG: hypothetical protein ACTS5R_01310 [Candidatus Hodgkinia cicadicola]
MRTSDDRNVPIPKETVTNDCAVGTFERFSLKFERRRSRTSTHGDYDGGGNNSFSLRVRMVKGREVVLLMRRRRT